MFTGLVESIGRVVAVRKESGELDLEVDLGALAEGLEPGASIALAGACCTLVRTSGAVGVFRLSAETLRRTWFASLAPGQLLNVERALRAGAALGGHFVQGHVDGVGRVLTPVESTRGGELRVGLTAECMRYCVEKGSIAIDGVSLTIANMDANSVTIAVIPHTAHMTTLGSALRDTPVNVEVDILAKYVERMLRARGDVPARP